MIGLLIFLALIAVMIIMYVGGIFSWCLSKLRLLVPVIFIILCIFLEGHKDWLITKILFYNIPYTKDFPVMDLILYIMIFYAIIMFFHDILAPIINKIRGVKIQKQQQQAQKRAVYNAFIRNQEKEKKEKKVFSIMPAMEKEYYYFKNQCKNEELAFFESDWEKYINEAYKRLSLNESNTYSFEDWYGDNDMWKKRTYNKEFLAKERQFRH